MIIQAKPWTQTRMHMEGTHLSPVACSSKAGFVQSEGANRRAEAQDSALIPQKISS